MYIRLSIPSFTTLILAAETMHLRLGLEATWPGLEPGENPQSTN